MASVDSPDVVLPCENTAYWEKAKEILQRDAARSVLEAVLRMKELLPRRAAEAFTLRTLMNVLGDDESEDAQRFVKETLPFICRLALASEEVLAGNDVRVLRAQDASVLALSRRQVASIMACAFLGLFHGADRKRKTDFEWDRATRQWPFSFSYILTAQKAKTLALLHYFERIGTAMPGGGVTIRRLVGKSMPAWEACDATLAPLDVFTKGNIEDNGVHMVQADFANEFIGGGVLQDGCVQEEIRFGVTNPELFVSMLVVDRMDANEAVLLTGFERYCNYAGYGFSLAYAGDHEDAAERDADGAPLTPIVAMDALPFAAQRQWKPDNIVREINKAFVAFDLPEGTPREIATGNWGCGAFGGNKELKAIQQLIAASAAGRKLAYFTFGDDELASGLRKLYERFTAAGMSAGAVYTLLRNVIAQSSSLGRNTCLFRAMHAALDTES